MRSLALVLLFCCVAATGQTLYKQVDKDGNVTYTDKPPAKDEKAEKVDINTKRNVTVPQAPRMQTTKPSLKDVQRRNLSEQELRKEVDKARNVLAEAKAALAAGQEPADDEWIGMKGGGRVPNEAFLKRRQELEEAVKEAEANLAAAEAAARKGTAN